jgi:hypothetical protein
VPKTRCHQGSPDNVMIVSCPQVIASTTTELTEATAGRKLKNNGRPQPLSRQPALASELVALNPD